MNILVTGGAGFIGARMAERHLADGHRVVVVDDLSTGFREKVPRRRAVRPGGHRRDRPRAAPARGEDRLRLAPRGADRPAAQRLRSALRRAVEHPGVAEALRGLPPRGLEARPLLLDRRRALRRAGGRPAGARVAPDQSGLALRLREALDREVPPLLPRHPRLPDAGLPLRERVRPGPERDGRGGRRRDLLRDDPPRKARRRSAATAARRATTSTSATSSAPPRRRSRRTGAGPGTSARESRRASTTSSEVAARRSTTARSRSTRAAAPGRAAAERPRRLDVRRDFSLPEWTPLAKGIQMTAEYFRRESPARA